LNTQDSPRSAVEVAHRRLRPRRHWFQQLLLHRSVQVTAGLWTVANIVVVLTADDTLPFDWPNRPGRSVTASLLEVNAALLQVLLLMVLVRFLTRNRKAPDLLGRAPSFPVARRETALLVGYGSCGLLGGFFLARAFGWHPFGLHLAGTIYGTHDTVTPAEAITWAVYNLVVYAVVPLLAFRRRYSPLALNLKSTNRSNDTVVIVVVLTVESALQLLALQPAILDLSIRQLGIGAVLAFLLYLAGAVLPAMVFVYAILVPRFLRLTGSPATTVILGGLAYTLLHVWDAWTMFDTAQNGVLSILFLGFTYFGPGMIKTVLTIYTGNAWVHVWAYHAFAPHTLLDTAHTVDVFHVR
jgi:hypothetical protein